MDRKDKAAAKREQKFTARRRERQVIDFSELTWEPLQYALSRVLSKGGAVRIGLTRDQGAWAIGVYGKGEPFTDYVRAGEGIAEFLYDLGAFFEED